MASVSVVLASNRGGPFLGEALGSAISQSSAPLEVILVDDGSPDPGAMAASAATFPGVHVIRTDGVGVSAARNTGAALAKGQWIAFLDDDDRWDIQRLERQLGDLAKMPDAVVGYCSLRTIDEAGVVLAEGEHIQVDGRLDVLRQRTGILVPNSLIRRDAFEEVGGFDAAYRFAEDLDLMIRLSALGSFVLTSGDLVDYRLHAANTTSRHRELCAGVESVLKQHRSLAREQGDRDAIAAINDGLRANRRYAWWRTARALRSGHDGHWGQRVGELAWAVRFAPLAPADALIRRIRN
jgi:alpha-1,3-rhamnosyltransferase